MFQYEKKLNTAINIKRPNPALAKIIITQYGGPDGELWPSAALPQSTICYAYNELKGLLTDIGLQELGHSNGGDNRPSA